MKTRLLTPSIVFILALLLSSCRAPLPTPLPPGPTSPAEPTPLPTETPQPSPTPTYAPLEEPSVSSPEALAACDLEKQALVMQPDRLPDWNSLGIDACYDLSFDLSADGVYSGAARITFTNLYSQALEDIALRLYPNAPVIYGGRLTLTGASAGGQALSQQPLLEDGTALRLVLPQPLATGETIVLELTFDGQLPLDSPGADTYGVFNLNTLGPIAVLVNSYPLIAVREGGGWRVDPILPEGDPVVSKTALYLAQVRLPEGWKLAATGITLEQGRDSGQEIYQLVGGPVREFVWTASPAFEERSTLVRDTFLQHWALPETEPAWAEALLVTEDALEIFNDLFGAYPYAELDVVALPLKNASGVEYPGLILIRDYLYTTTDTPRLLPLVVAHEVAHQWWYAVVGSDVLRYPWQDEGLATFSAQLYASRYDPTFYEGTNAYYQSRVKEIESQYGQQPIDQPVSAYAGTSSKYAVIAYQKSALFFEALRARIGEDVFYNALKEYYTANQYQIASPDELLDSFENACGCDLEGLYDEWGAR